MEIQFSCSKIPGVDEIIELYRDAGLPRPIKDRKRMKKMIAHSNLYVSAWNDQVLVGLARSVTDWSWCCYLADLAVRTEYKNSGIGRQLIQLTRQQVGKQSMILLLSVPGAMSYYPKIGFSKCENSFIIQRTEK